MRREEISSAAQLKGTTSGKGTEHPDHSAGPVFSREVLCRIEFNGVVVLMERLLGRGRVLWAVTVGKRERRFFTRGGARRALLLMGVL